jgi:DNA-binding response OmpR family regulator
VDSSTNLPNLKGVKTLIIARDGVLRDGLQTMLAGLFREIQIDLLEDGSLAACQGKRMAYDLVFLYAGLPSETRLAATRGIKAVSPETIIIMVAESEEETRLALKAGSDQVLLKGFSTAQLITALNGFYETNAEKSINSGLPE